MTFSLSTVQSGTSCVEDEDGTTVFFYPASEEYTEEETNWMNGAAELDEKFCLSARPPPIKAKK